MALLKYSRQREAIKNYLASTRNHPTADIVYMHVKKEFPNISLGTVYRNLNLLTDLGEAVRITLPDGADRFDGHTEPHNHFYCTHCKKVLDLDLDTPVTDIVTQAASAGFEGIIKSSNTFFYGLCGDCVKDVS